MARVALLWFSRLLQTLLLRLLPPLSLLFWVLAALGSSPFAFAISRGVKINSFYTLHSKGESQALTMKKTSGATNPKDLPGKVRTAGITCLET